MREARADADAHRERNTGVGVERGQLALQRQSCPYGSFRVVLVGALRTPHRHHRITDVLVDPPAMFRHDQVEAGPDVVHHPCHELRVHPLRHRGEPTHIGEQHRHLAPPGCGGIEIRELMAEGADGDLEHLIGHDAPQRLLRGDRSLELLTIGRHALPSNDRPTVRPIVRAARRPQRVGGVRTLL